ncbi:family 43 glycosylhydrolase [Pendulispora rubella]|uniref:Family 43 glycosylhydrolase n=1 Tax=Pendulispora rubella TaxID=2741070 RepID=A0ABZ2KPJ4_9BACT
MTMIHGSETACVLALLACFACACSDSDGDTPPPPPATPDGDGGVNAYEVTSGPFLRIYDPSVGETSPWYINDHTFVRGQDGTWHLFGITHAEPANPLDEKTFAHATSPSLAGGPWQKQAPALVADPAYGETLLWAPYVIFHDGKYYMFYCAGGDDHAQYQIRLATSTDLWTWAREPAPLFTDGFDARDPMVLRVGNQWVLYYTATSEAAGGAHVVAYRTSTDLRHFGERHIAYEEPASGTYGGPTESPFVVAMGEDYYLFIGPRSSYSSTGVFYSKNPLHFEPSNQVGSIPAHAAEVIDDNGSWYVSAAGWGQGGVSLAPLRWEPTAYVNVTRPTYRATVQIAPRATLRSFLTTFPGEAPRELLTSRFRATGPYLAVGAFDVTDAMGAPAQVERSPDGTRLSLKSIPLGNEPVTVDWNFVFGEDYIDHALTWHVAAEPTAPVWETAFGLDTVFPWVGDDANLQREGDAAGFARWSLSGDDHGSLVFAYRAGSAWREDNRWFASSRGAVSWQPLWRNGGATWTSGMYEGGTFRMAASPRGGDRLFAERVAAALNGADQRISNTRYATPLGVRSPTAIETR